MAAVALTIGEDNQFELTATTAAGVLHKIFRIEREELCLLDSPRPLTLENSTRLDELEAELSHANRELPELFYKLHECTARELGKLLTAHPGLVGAGRIELPVPQPPLPCACLEMRRERSCAHRVVHPAVIVVQAQQFLLGRRCTLCAIRGRPLRSCLVRPAEEGCGLPYVVHHHVGPPGCAGTA